MPLQRRPRRVNRAGRPLLHLRVCAPGHRASISPMVKKVMEALEDNACAAGKQFEIEVALREALANAVIHGCHDDPSKPVECELSCRGSGELVMVVRDPGPGFDPASIASPVVDANLYSPHGRGIYLITCMVGEATFARGGREVRMILRRRPPAEV